MIVVFCLFIVNLNFHISCLLEIGCVHFIFIEMILNIRPDYK